MHSSSISQLKIAMGSPNNCLKTKGPEPMPSKKLKMMTCAAAQVMGPPLSALEGLPSSYLLFSDPDHCHGVVCFPLPQEVQEAALEVNQGGEDLIGGRQEDCLHGFRALPWPSAGC